MMIVASLVPNYLMGIITGAGIQGIMMLGGGFFRLPQDLPKAFWKYPLYYVAFHRYAYEGLFKNEFSGSAFPNGEVVGGGGDILTGEEILREKWGVDLSYSKWGDLAALLGMVVLYRVLFLVIIKATEKFKSLSASCAMARRKQQETQIVDNFIGLGYLRRSQRLLVENLTAEVQELRNTNAESQRRVLEMEAENQRRMSELEAENQKRMSEMQAQMKRQDELIQQLLHHQLNSPSDHSACFSQRQDGSPLPLPAPET